jgi:hypothetical protein
MPEVPIRQRSASAVEFAADERLRLVKTTTAERLRSARATLAIARQAIRRSMRIVEHARDHRGESHLGP